MTRFVRHLVVWSIIAMFVAGSGVNVVQGDEDYNPWEECKDNCAIFDQKLWSSYYAACYWVCVGFVYWKDWPPEPEPIGPEGGTINIHNDTLEWPELIEIDIPPGALTETTTYTLQAIEQPYIDSVPYPYFMTIMAFELSPPTAFNEPVTINITYGDYEFCVFSEEDLTAGRFNTDTQTWELIPSTVDYESNVITFEVDQLHIFGVIAMAKPAPVPALTPLGLIALIGLLSLIAVITVRRRQK